MDVHSCTWRVPSKLPDEARQIKGAASGNFAENAEAWAEMAAKGLQRDEARIATFSPGTSTHLRRRMSAANGHRMSAGK